MSDKETTKNVHTLPLKNKNTPSTSIEEVLKEIENWRANKPHVSTAMPDALWRKIFTLAQTYTASKLRALLGINTKQYNSKYEQIFTSAGTDKKHSSTPAPQANLIDFCQVNTSSTGGSSASMYKPLKIPSSNTIIAEFYHADGRIMKIHSTCESVHRLIQAFFQDLKNVAVNIQT